MAKRVSYRVTARGDAYGKPIIEEYLLQLNAESRFESLVKSTVIQGPITLDKVTIETLHRMKED